MLVSDHLYDFQLGFIIVSTSMIAVTAYGGGSHGGRGYSSGGAGGYASRGFSGGGVIPAAIQTRHQISYREVPSSGFVQPATIEVAE